MTVMLITGGVVVATISGLSAVDVAVNNPGMLVIEDTSGRARLIGMHYSDGVLSGEPTPEPIQQAA